MTTTVTATTRYGLTPAPGGLALVQDVVNSRAAGRPREPDLLGSGLDVAQGWLAGLVEEWASATVTPTPDLPALREPDLPRLRALRDDVTQVLRRDGTPASLGDGATVLLARGEDGQVSLSLVGGPVGWLVGAVVGEVLRARTARVATTGPGPSPG
ncbi:hypothetical protein GCM10023201_52900 [Actinomycetospora corticicola]|uniref:Uncharacterized protein n=1 Tax=Actinomycetospora corticicola TaxID=663602 RepID=A0A7Y9J6X7_9PSEU|nr:hypothetical protein [Actinomycetospora corticicola]NYD37446.1 hypothetical protein [Actinomycetospora corticicola]